MTNISDQNLIRKYLRGDEKSLEILILTYLKPIYSFAYRYVGNPQDAEDITQEVFVKVWRHLKRFDQNKSFKTWVFSIAKRTAIDWLRKNNAIPFSALGEEKEEAVINSLADESLSFFNQLVMQETSKELAFAVARLPVNYRSVVKLHINDGLHFREIADKFKEPLNTIKSRYRRGLALLKKILRD